MTSSSSLPPSLPPVGIANTKERQPAEDTDFVSEKLLIASASSSSSLKDSSIGSIHSGEFFLGEPGSGETRGAGGISLGSSSSSPYAAEYLRSPSNVDA